MYLDRGHEIRTSGTAVLATVMWVASFGVWVISWVADAHYLAELSILFAAAAGTLSVRSFMLHQAEEFKTALIVTGRDVVGPRAVP